MATSNQVSDSSNIDQFLNFMEQTVEESTFDPKSLTKPFNPDDLYEKRFDYSIYDDMLKDDQVSVLSKIKKDLILGATWSIEPSTEDQNEYCEALTSVLRHDIENETFEESLEQILTASDYGFSLTEKVFKKLNDGFITLKSLKTRHPATFNIYTDRYGNVEKLIQLASVGGELVIDPAIMIHYINNPKFQNPYGQSDLRPAYAAYFIKQNILRYYAIFLEKAASPIPIAKYDQNIPSGQIDKLFNIIQRFQVKTAIVVPKAVDIDFIHAGQNGDFYKMAIDLFNMFIGRALFVPDLAGFQGSETSGGSYSLGENQIGIFLKHIARRKEKLQSIVNQHIIRPICIANYGVMDQYPYFRLSDPKEETTSDFAKIWIEAQRSKIYVPSEDEVNHFRSLIKFPEGDVDLYDAPQEIPAQVQVPGAPFVGEPEISEPQITDDIAQNEEDGPIESDKPDINEDDIKPVKAPTPFAMNRTDFKAIETMLDRNENRTEAKVKTVVKEIMADVITQISKRKIIENQKVNALEGFKVKRLVELGRIIKNQLLETYNESAEMAEAELIKTNKINSKKFARTPLPDERYLALILNEIDAFQTDFEASFIKKVRQQLNRAIRDGVPASEIYDFLEEDIVDELLRNVTTFNRTKSTDVFNRGRIGYFTNSGIVQGYQYTAVLDNVTTEICRGLGTGGENGAGKFFKAGTEPIPPMHFNCRSLLIPVTIYEEFEADTKVGNKDIDKFIEENIGKGFSRR